MLRTVDVTYPGNFSLRCRIRIEHIAIETDDYAGALANFKKNGARNPLGTGQQRSACVRGCPPDRAQMELIEKV
jgi:hypothetical protein